MLLHDSFFYLLNQSINETHYNSTIMAHSPLFNSTLTLILSIFGFSSNFICLLYLCFIISQYKKRKLKNYKIEQQTSIHILSHKKYRFLVLLTSNDLLLCLSSIISCLDEKYYSQSLIARHHLCSFHILIWKFTLHFTPLLTIFILCRYYYISNKKFPLKFINTTTLTQLLCTDLCILIPFVIALAWSVDGLWLWGETDLRSFVTPPISDNQTDEVFSSSTTSRNLEQSNIKLKSSSNNFYLSEPKLICYLQTNDNLNFTTRILYLIQADFVLLFSLHFIGFLLEIFLHIHLCCCLITRKITSIFLHEQQISLYILYIFICLTLTSIPFYFYRSIEMLFNMHVSSNHSDTVNSRILAQTILVGTSFKPILYLILICPSNILFQFKCYTSIQIDTINQDDATLVINQQQQHKRQFIRSQHRRYSFHLSTLYPKIQFNSRTISSPGISSNNHQAIISNL